MVSDYKNMINLMGLGSWIEWQITGPKVWISVDLRL